MAKQESEHLLPDGDYYMVTMQIADSFGGLTAAMLERARVFAEMAQVPTWILTVDPRPSYKDVREKMIAEGRITSRVTLLNLHEDFRTSPVSESTPKLSPTELTVGEWTFDSNGSPFSYSVDEQIHNLPASISYTNAQGYVYLHEERTYSAAGNRNGRTFTRYDAAGTTSYANAGALYRAWFDEIRRNRTSYLIVDSKYSATHFATYDAADTYKFHVLHGFHAVAAGNAIAAPLTPPRKPVLVSQERWDGIIALTERNKQDLDLRFGRTNNRFVVSNIVERSERFPSSRLRSRKNGVMVARLAPVKGIPLALKIMKRANKLDPEITLDIYGGGPELESLLALRHELGLDHVVTFHGAVEGAAKFFETAAFTLLTSKSEMQPLVLMEAMGRGCPSVAHDIRYGPRDLISDGHNGFVVSPGDANNAANKIVALTKNRFRAKRISKNAWTDAEKFGAHGALRQWAETIQQAAKNRTHRIVPDVLAVGPIEFTEQNLHVSAELSIETTFKDGNLADLEYALVWMNRTSGTQQLIPGVRQKNLLTFANVLPVDIDPLENDEPLDAYIQISGRNLSRRLRVPIESDHSEIQFNGRSSYRTVNGYWSLRK